MNMKLTKGYILAVLALLILVAAGILLLNNLGGEWNMQFFWKPVTLRPAVGMLLAAAAGVAVWYTVLKILPTAFASLRKGKKFQQTQNDHKRLKNLENSKGDSPKLGES
ncbi:MAG: hypothetical protein K8R91_05250 [Phycisphaerae bacterium]|nr:hypothetical protein [Phycisphaerae bacterium]